MLGLCRCFSSCISVLTLSVPVAFMGVTAWLQCHLSGRGWGEVYVVHSESMKLSMQGQLRTCECICMHDIHHLGFKSPAVYLLQHLQSESSVSDNPWKSERDLGWEQGCEYQKQKDINWCWNMLVEQILSFYSISQRLQFWSYSLTYVSIYLLVAALKLEGDFKARQV